jgi:hypothetical protein
VEARPSELATQHNYLEGRGHTTTPADVPVVWLSPKQSSSGVLIGLHGGAYVSGPVASEWDWMTEVQKQTSVAMGLVIYRMPPEHPYPAALEDAVNAIVTTAARFPTALSSLLSMPDSDAPLNEHPPPNSQAYDSAPTVQPEDRAHILSTSSGSADICT